MRPIQIRLGRIALGWGVRELASASGISANTVNRIETGRDAKASTIDALRNAMEAKGVVFIRDGGAVGIKFDESSLTEAGDQIQQTKKPADR